MTQLEMTDIVFYALAMVTVGSAACVILLANPVFSALTLAITMTSISAIFFMLGAPFIAAVQLIVYAGAVMVMFVMVLMLFDLRQEKKVFSSGLSGSLLKVGCVAFFLGIVLSALKWSSNFTAAHAEELVETGLASTKVLAMQLFTKHMISFQFVGILLLVVLIGAISLARSRGGTHAS